MSKTINTQYTDLLILILRGKNTSTKISKALKIPRRTVSNRLTWLFRKGYVDKQIIFNSRPYELTEKGKDALKIHTAKVLATPKGRPKTGPIKLRAHKVTWFFEITKKPYELNDLLTKHAFTAHKNRRWIQYKKINKGHKIVFNPNKVYVYSDELYIDNPMEYYPMAIEKLEKIKHDLETRFPGLVLGKPNRQMVCASNHIAKEWGPLAKYFYERSLKDGKKYIYHGDKLNVDWSKGVPEEETVDKRTAPADMLELGNFWNDWLKNPIKIQDLHQTQQASQETSTGVLELKQLAQAHTTMLMKNTEQFTKQLSQITEVVAGNTESNKVFANAMAEHVQLVKALQTVAYKTRDGMETLSKEVGKQMKEGFMHMGQIMVDTMIELKKPWYMRLYDNIRSRWGGNE